ncbi:hypothetical protein BKA57DRAFT_538317 [Linnemannia elongata]|nr:hypothetical protein BKA57DRAFT_538317 [Linnemannia elongata]
MSMISWTENDPFDRLEQRTTLSAESKFSQDYGRDNMRYQERRFGAFMRTIPLPDHVNGDSFDANFKGGELSLFLPKGEAVQPRRLPSLK